MIDDWRLGIGDWRLEIGDWRLEIGDWSLVVSRWGLNRLFFVGGDEELGRIEDVLPNDIGSGTKRREGVKVGICHPYTKRGVFLPESLSGGDRADTGHSLGCGGGVDENILIVPTFAGGGQIIADEFTKSELDEAGKERGYKEPKNNE